MSPASTPIQRRFAAAHELARCQGGVVSRRQLYAMGVTRWEIRAQVAGLRWQLIGDQSVCLHNSDLTTEGHHWAAVFQGGPRACLDGVTALIAGGLERVADTSVRVSVPRGARIRRTKCYDIRQTRRWSPTDRAPSGIPRTRPAVAAIRGALWARTDKEAAFIVSATVQQGLTTPEQLGEEVLRIRRHRRRGFLHVVVNDLLDGARSLGELEFSDECRRRGLPPPDPPPDVIRMERGNAPSG